MFNLEEQFRNLTIKMKLNRMVIVSVTLMCILGLGALFGAFQLNAQTKKLHDDYMNANTLIAELDYKTSQVRLEQYGHLISSTDKDMTTREDNIEKLIAEISILTEEYEQTILNETDQLYLDAAKDAWSRYLAATGEDFFALSRNMKLDEANAIMLGEGYEAFLEFQDNFDQLLDFNHESAEKASNQATLVFWLICVMSVVMVIAASLIALYISRIIVKGIVTAVREIKYATEEMTLGKLDAEIQYQSKDELGEIADSIREVQKNLGAYIREISTTLEVIATGDLTKDFEQITDFLGEFSSIKHSFVRILKEFNITLNRIQNAASDVDSGSDELAGAATDLATGTGEQASAVEELTATVTTVSSMAEASAKEANEASREASKAVEEAETERRHMNELKEEMGRIKEISAQIEVIVTSIEDIASQTSLLALNASIEAARAGEAGRGFAVVADQIGKLATDSAQAVVNTKDLIAKTVEAIDKGSSMTDRTAEGFEMLIGELEGFAELAQRVSDTASTQAQALEQVENGIEQISNVTQQNAAASEECSAISEELAARAAEMTSQIMNFTLHKG